MIHIPVTKKQQEGFLNELHKMPHVKHDFDKNSGTVDVQEKGVKLSYRLVVEISVDSNSQNIPEKVIEQGLTESLEACARP